VTVTAADPPAPAEITLRTEDGCALRGQLFAPTSLPRHAVVICSGAGIPASRYRHFAAHLAARGVAALTFDYRGIGGSRSGTPRQAVARFEDWSEFDVSAAIRAMADRYPDVAIAGVAHSFGTLLMLACPEAARVSRLVLVCGHTGYVGDYPLRYALPMALAWHVLMPATTLAFGYFPGARMRLGEDLPRGIALQWATRVRPGLAGRAGSRMRRLLDHARALDKPALVLRLPNDAFASARGERRLLSLAPRLAVSRPSTSLEPLPPLGHFGFFRAGAPRFLWDLTLAYILHGTDAAADDGGTDHR
jgi:predicted alpha/beta hydrolase